MTSLVRIKRSETSGNPAILAAGQLAYSGLLDNGSNGGDRLYIGMGTETAGNAVNHVVIGGKYFTDQISAATDLNTAGTLVKRNTSGGVFLDVTGSLTGNASTSSAWATGRNLSFTGDATATLTSVTGAANVSAALTLATVNSAVGTYGSTTQIPVVTVNAKGLVTGVTTASISTALTIAGTTGSDVVTLGVDTLTFAGTNGVTATVTNNLVTINVDQSAVVPTFGGIITGSINVTGDTTIAGNLTVNGTTTTINSTTLTVNDKNIELAKGSVTAAAANGAGITVTGPAVPATITYSSADDSWNVNKPLTVGVLNATTIYGTITGNAPTASTWLTPRSLTLNGDASATFASVDGSASITTSLTLNTVNSTPGSFGSAVSVPSFTVNGKGLITAITANAIPTATSSVLGLSKFDLTTFDVTAGLVSILLIDGGTY